MCADWLPLNKMSGERRRAFTRFCNHMFLRPAGTSLDRIDPYGHYEPGNVRWATKETQVYNKRRNYPGYGRRRAA